MRDKKTANGIRRCRKFVSFPDANRRWLELCSFVRSGRRGVVQNIKDYTKLIREEHISPMLRVVVLVFLGDDEFGWLGDPATRGESLRLLGAVVDIASAERMQLVDQPDELGSHRANVRFVVKRIDDAIDMGDLEMALGRTMVLGRILVLLSEATTIDHADQAMARLARAPAPSDSLAMEAADAAARVAMAYSRWQWLHTAQALAGHPRLREFARKSRPLELAFRSLGR